MQYHLFIAFLNLPGLDAHQRTESSIRRAREIIFWPSLQAAIRERALNIRLRKPVETIRSHDAPMHTAMEKSKY